MCISPLKAFDTGFFSSKTGKPIYIVKGYDIDYIYKPINQLYAEQKTQSFNKVFRDYKIYNYIEVPCGSCIECRLEHARQWAFRCVKEAQQHKFNMMATLTYSEDTVPRSFGIDKEGELVPTVTLCKRDVQLFLKRLRKNTGQKFRYFYCGEYGEKRGRPHYHIIFFGLRLQDLKFWKFSILEWSKEKNQLFTSEIMNKTWQKGIVALNEVSFESCAYVARYVTKKYKGSDSEEHYKRLGQVPEYICMSRRPGIGEAFFEENKEKFFNDEKFFQKTRRGLIRVKGGRYFDKQIEKADENVLKILKKLREKNLEEYETSIFNKTNLTKKEYIANKKLKYRDIHKKLIRR